MDETTSKELVDEILWLKDRIEYLNFEKLIMNEEMMSMRKDNELLGHTNKKSRPIYIDVACCFAAAIIGHCAVKFFL